MGFNYTLEKQRFDAEWSRCEKVCREEGFDEDRIAELRENDWAWFKARRIYELKTLPLPSDEIDSSCRRASNNTNLLVWHGDEVWTGRFGWVDTIEDSELANKLISLSDSDKELLTLLVFDGYMQNEIAVMQGCSQQAISKRLRRLKNFLGLGL